MNDDERNGNSGSAGPIVAATEKKKREGPATDMKLEDAENENNLGG